MPGEKIAVVTGAGAGIGASIAQAFAAQGYELVLVDSDQPSLAMIAEQLSVAGVRCLSRVVDVSDGIAIERLAGDIRKTFGRVDVLVNCAADKSGGRILELSEAAWDRSLAVNVKSIFLMTKALLDCLENSVAASIVNISSTAAMLGIPGMAAYCAGKGAVLALTRALAMELAPVGIRVNAICPASVQTASSEISITRRAGGDLANGLAQLSSYYPLGRIAQPEEIARVVTFLAGSESSFITGQSIAVDGGLSAQYAPSIGKNGVHVR